MKIEKSVEGNFVLQGEKKQIINLTDKGSKFIEFMYKFKVLDKNNIGYFKLTKKEFLSILDTKIVFEKDNFIYFTNKKIDLKNSFELEIEDKDFNYNFLLQEEFFSLIEKEKKTFLIKEEIIKNLMNIINDISFLEEDKALKLRRLIDKEELRLPSAFYLNEVNGEGTFFELVEEIDNRLSLTEMFNKNTILMYYKKHKEEEVLEETFINEVFNEFQEYENIYDENIYDEDMFNEGIGENKEELSENDFYNDSSKVEKEEDNKDKEKENNKDNVIQMNKEKANINQKEEEEVLDENEILAKFKELSEVACEEEFIEEKIIKEKLEKIQKKYSIYKKYIYDDTINEILKNKDNYVILDTETTGIGIKDEIIQLSIIDLDGNVLINEYFCPFKTSEMGAIEKHGLSFSFLKNMPKWETKFNEFKDILKNKTLIIHNENFDKRLIEQTCLLHNVEINFEMKSVCSESLSDNKLGLRSIQTLAKSIDIPINKDIENTSLMNCFTVLYFLDTNSKIFKMQEEAINVFEVFCKKHNKYKDGEKWLEDNYSIKNSNILTCYELDKLKEIIEKINKGLKKNK